MSPLPWQNEEMVTENNNIYSLTLRRTHHQYIILILSYLLIYRHKHWRLWIIMVLVCVMDFGKIMDWGPLLGPQKTPDRDPDPGCPFRGPGSRMPVPWTRIPDAHSLDPFLGDGPTGTEYIPGPWPGWPEVFACNLGQQSTVAWNSWNNNFKQI